MFPLLDEAMPPILQVLKRQDKYPAIGLICLHCVLRFTNLRSLDVR
jgi:hypothetical protein